MAAVANMDWALDARARRLPSEDRAPIERAQTIGEAAMWLLAIAVGSDACEGGLVHCIDPCAPRLVTRAVHAPRMKPALGATVSMHDAAFLGVMRNGANDALTDWAQSMTTLRLTAAGLSAVGVLTMPLRARGVLAGFLEVSTPQRRRAFTPTNIAVLRELADAFEARPSAV